MKNSARKILQHLDLSLTISRIRWETKIANRRASPASSTALPRKSLRLSCLAVPWTLENTTLHPHRLHIRRMSRQGQHQTAQSGNIKKYHAVVVTIRTVRYSEKPANLERFQEKMNSSSKFPYLAHVTRFAPHPLPAEPEHSFTMFTIHRR